MPVTFEMLPRCGPHYHRRPDGTEEVFTRGGQTITLDSADELRGASDKFRQVSPAPPPVQAGLGLIPVKRVDGKYDLLNEATEKPLNAEGLSLSEAAEMARRPPVKFVVKARENAPSWFDVVSVTTGLPINASALRLKEAEELAAKGESKAPEE